MGEREWWENVYKVKPEHESACGYRYYGGQEQYSREDSVRVAERNRRCGSVAVFRVHVRLKPQGAPKRYTSEANRRAWESNPAQCRRLAEAGFPSEVVFSVPQSRERNGGCNAS